MAKHTETIRPQLPTNCLSMFDHFVGLAVKRLKCTCKYSFKSHARVENLSSTNEKKVPISSVRYDDEHSIYCCKTSLAKNDVTDQIKITD